MTSNKQEDDCASEESTGWCVSWLKRNGFVLLLVLATCGGYGVGLLMKPLNLSNHTISLVGFPGQLMLRAFFMIIIPLLFCSLVIGVSSLRKGGDARMVAITIAFFLGLSIFSAIMGAAAGHVVHPGQKITGDAIEKQTTLSGRKGVILESMLDLLRNAIPNNIIEATFMKQYTHVEIVNSSDEHSGGSNFSTKYRKSMQRQYGVNFMGLLTFSIIFGSALASLGDKGEGLYRVIEQLNAVIMKMLDYFLKILPLGMFFWMFQEGLQSDAPVQLLSYLGVFIATALSCMAFHQLVLLPLLYVLIVRKSPVRFHLNLLPAMLTAFGTSSSAATLPATMQCCEEVNHLNKGATRFVLPLGMVVHMNGSTFYLTIASIFLAQLEGITLETAETVVLCVTIVLLMISAPATANSGNPVFLLTAMAAAGIDKPKYLSLILQLEWLMERLRTVMNVVADSYVTAFVEKLCYKRLTEDPDCIEFVSPVLDGYNHPVAINPADDGVTCRCCGSRKVISRESEI